VDRFSADVEDDEIAPFTTNSARSLLAWGSASSPWSQSYSAQGFGCAAAANNSLPASIGAV